MPFVRAAASAVAKKVPPGEAAAVRDLVAMLDQWRAELTEGISDPTLEHALATRDLSVLASDPVWGKSWDAVQADLQAQLLDTLADSGARELRSLGMRLRFDIDNPFAQSYAATQTARLVTNVTEETKAAIRGLVGNAFVEGVPPHKLAMAIRPLVGLTDRDARAAQSMHESLLDDGVEPDEAMRKAGLYADRLWRRRAENIARTETITASNAGKQASWEHAHAQGKILPGAKRVWIASVSERTCELCESVLNGQQVDLREPFDAEGESVFHPPAHPSCRCTMALVTDLDDEEDGESDESDSEESDSESDNESAAGEGDSGTSEQAENGDE